MRIFSLCFNLAFAEQWTSRSVQFDDLATATWSYNVDDAKNPEAPIRFEIETKLSEFSFGWNRYLNEILFYKR